jgi:hypothetical protein
MGCDQKKNFKEIDQKKYSHYTERVNIVLYPCFISFMNARPHAYAMCV